MQIDYIMIAIVLGFVVFDVLTGVLKGAVSGTLSSSVMRQGLYHKGAYLLAITFAGLCQFAWQHFALPDVLQGVLPATCIYIVLTEITSVIENIAEINPELKNVKFLALFAQGEPKEEQ